MAKKTLSDLELLIDELRVVAGRIEVAKANDDAGATKRARLALDTVTKQLTSVSERLDPVLRPTSIFDPTDPNTAGRVIALTLVAQPKHPLSTIPSFYGSGVYAIYYEGTFEAYGQLSGIEHPLYVGKADPDNHAINTAVSQGTKLSARLTEHAKSIRNARTTLAIEDFKCRFLIVQTGFQKSAEDYLISFFKPIWNSETKICFGLGKHGDSSETRGNKRSPWDTMHPGRSWADKSAEDQKPRELIVEQIARHLWDNPPYKDIHEIFDKFVADMRQLNPEQFYTPELGSVLLEAGNATQDD